MKVVKYKKSGDPIAAFYDGRAFAVWWYLFGNREIMRVESAAGDNGLCPRGGVCKRNSCADFRRKHRKPDRRKEGQKMNNSDFLRSKDRRKRSIHIKGTFENRQAVAEECWRNAALSLGEITKGWWKEEEPNSRPPFDEYFSEIIKEKIHPLKKMIRRDLLFI